MLSEKANILGNNFEYVDLGLPSGTLWATCNVGASKPTDYGQYFQWGDTQGYTAEQVGKDKQFTDTDYKWFLGYSKSGDAIFKKYAITGSTLELEDDAVHANMGGDWRMPTPTQISELLDNTTNTWTTQDGVNGRLFTSKSDPSKSIFFPAAGDAWAGSVQGSGDYGGVWSSMLFTDFVGFGKYLSFNSGGVGLYSRNRCDGLSVRGVIDGKQNDTKDKKENTIMDKENKAMIDRHNSLKAFDDEIESLQEKIKEIKKKKDACLTDDYSKMYTGKYVRITRKGFPYIKECIYVRSVYTDMDSDKFALKLQGQGFCYSAGDYLDEIEGNFSEIYSTTIFENWLNNGTIKVSLISKDEYKNEVNKMLDFISKDFDDVEVIE